MEIMESIHKHVNVDYKWSDKIMGVSCVERLPGTRVPTNNRMDINVVQFPDVATQGQKAASEITLPNDKHFSQIEEP